jgi:membrane protease YdiL (CAAX protease family)
MLSGLGAILGGLGLPLVSLLVEYAAYLIPIIAFVVYIRRFDTKKHIVVMDKGAKGILLCMPLVFISLFIVMGISFLTSAFLAYFGKSDTGALDGSLWFLISRYALVPSLLEEVLFRLIPLSFIAPYSKKSALVISSVIFALSHISLFDIPYALAAGLIYMLADIVAESVIPSVIMHLVNNIFAIFWQKLLVPVGLSLYSFLSVGALALISMLIIIAQRRHYKGAILSVFNKKDAVCVDNSFLLFVIITSAISIFSLF